MNDVKTEEMTIPVPGGYVFVKTWIPDQNIAQAPLILLHDSLGSVAQWRDFPVYLAKQLSRKVIAYDRLGFGKSSSREMLPSIDFVSEESEIYFPYIKEGLSIKKFVLMGHSVGGGMAINIAANDTDCLGVATISAQAFVEEMTLRGITQAKEMFSNPEQVAKLEKWHGEKAGWVLRAWTDRWLSPEFREWSLDNCIRKVTCPVLAIHGDKDEYGSKAFPCYIAENTLGRSKQVILENCGHVPHKEKTEEVLYHVTAFWS